MSFFYVLTFFFEVQIFLTPACYAHTNSQIESYNNKIKAQFKKRIKHHLKSAMDVFNEVIDYESKKNKLKLLVQSLDHVLLNDTNIHK
jgi:hypothetical protein